MHIFICLTPLHFYISYIYAEKFYNEHAEESLILLKAGYRYQIAEKPGQEGGLNCLFVYNGNPVMKGFNHVKYKHFLSFTEFGQSLNNCSVLHVFNDNDPITRRALTFIGENTKVILMEEGNATWHANRIGSHPRIDEVRTGQIDYFKKSHPDFKGICKPMIYSEIFNENNAKKFLKLIGFDDSALSGVRMKALFLGQPLEPQNKYRKFLKPVIQTLAEYEGVYLKPHPRDKKDFYNRLIEEFPNVSIMDSRTNIIPIECLVFAMNISTIVSVNSSSLIYIPFIRESCRPVFLVDFPEVRDFGIPGFDETITNDERYFFPKDIDELRGVIEC